MAELGPSAIARVELTEDGTDVVAVTTLATGMEAPLDLAVGPSGIIYVAQYSGMAVAYLAPGALPSPTVTQTPGGPTETATTTPLIIASPTPCPTHSVPVGDACATITPTPIVIPGDVNCDGTVDAIDAALVLQFSAGIILPLPCFGQADVNQDGSIDPIDATLILQYVAGLIPTLPVG
jgi:hypothetical protein